MYALVVIDTGGDGPYAFSDEVEYDNPSTLTQMIEEHGFDPMYVYDIFIIEGSYRVLGPDYLD